MKPCYAVLAVVFPLLLVGCAAPVVSSQTRALVAKERSLLEHSQVAVVADGCVLRYEVGTSFLSKADSQRIGEKLAADVSSELQADGVTVEATTAPLICGVFDLKVLKHFDLRQARNAPAEPIDELPIPSGTITPEAATAYADLFSAIGRIPAAAALNALNAPPDLDLKAAQIAPVRATSGARYALVVVGVGRQTSFARRFGVSMLEAVSSLAASGGSYVVTQVNPSSDGMWFSITLVDLDNRKVLWGNSLNVPGADPFLEASVSRQRARGLLSPLFAVAGKSGE